MNDQDALKLLFKHSRVLSYKKFKKMDIKEGNVDFKIQEMGLFDHFDDDFYQKGNFGEKNVYDNSNFIEEYGDFEKHLSSEKFLSNEKENAFVEDCDLSSDFSDLSDGQYNLIRKDQTAALEYLSDESDEIEILDLPDIKLELPLSDTKEGLVILSDFSTEGDHSLVNEEDRELTVSSYKLLPEEGIINPYKLRTAQGGINRTFRDGRSLKETKDALVANPNYTDSIPPIEIGIYKNKVYSFDTRRLIIHQQAKEQNPDIRIKYKKISGKHLEERINAIFSPRPWNGFVTAFRYGGKNSESVPYINPTLRPQLEENVQKSFKRYPNDRESADSNGFPVIKKKAQKIYEFLLKKKDKNDSQFAKKILKEFSGIYKEQGSNPAYHFLLNIKIDLLYENELIDKDNLDSQKASNHNSRSRSISEPLTRSFNKR